MAHQIKWKKLVVSSLKVLFAFGILIWLYQKGVLDLSVLKRLWNPSLLVMALLGLSLNFYLATWRWQLLLQVQKIALSRWECFKLNLVGLFFNYVVPGGVGGDVVKGFYIVREQPQNRMGAGMSVLVDRVLGLYAMLLLAIVSLLVNGREVSQSPQLLIITKGCILIFLAFTLGLVLAFSEKFRVFGWQNYLRKFPVGMKFISAYEALYSYAHQRGILIGAIALSLLAQIVAIFLMWWLGVNLGFGEVSLSLYFSVVPLGLIVTAVPIAPAGVGVGQMAFFFLFNLFLGGESQVGPTVITAYQVVNFLFGLFGVWFFLQRKEQHKGQHSEPWKEVESVTGP